MDLIDPRIAEIMAKLNNKETPQQTESKKKQEKKVEEPMKPPTTYVEYLKAEKLRDWPHRLTSENTLDLSDERERLGNKTMIEDELRQATPIDLHVLKSLENRLDKFDEVLQKYGRMVLELNKEEKQEEEDAKTTATDRDLPLSIPKDVEPQLGIEEQSSSVQSAFLTQMAESDAVKAHPSRKKKEILEMKDSFAEVRKKSVEHCVFPGYFKGELTSLPSQLEAPHILHRVTKAQEFNSGFRKFWKKIFLSEASVAVMQDTFWWIFLENFQKKRKEDQSNLFDRIADSFVALFNSINPEIKDKVFMVYADCLAQCIYAAFYEGFPESLRLFGEEFKQYLAELCATWVSGVKPPPGAAKHWNVKRMLPKTIRHLEDPGMQRREITMNGPVNPKLDMEDFMKQVDHLGDAPDDPTRNPFSKVVISALPGFGERGHALNANRDREHTKLTNFTAGVSKISAPVSNFPTVAQSRVVQLGSPQPTKRESHVIGPGAEIERVRFNLKGRSPLVAHYLHIHQLRDNKPAGGRVITRTEISKPPPSGLPTYRDLIRDTVKVQDALSKEYQKVCEETNQEIQRIERQQRDTNRKIAKLQKQLMQCKNSMEVKIMSERILEKQDVDSTKIVLKESFDEDIGESVNNSFSVNNSYSTHK